MDVALLTANCAQLRQVSKTLQSVSDRYPIPDPTQYSMTIPNPYPTDFQNYRVYFGMFSSACEKEPAVDHYDVESSCWSLDTSKFNHQRHICDLIPDGPNMW